ncbi:hypothetical protein Gotur_025128 [Gossypium turneri]
MAIGDQGKKDQGRSMGKEVPSHSSSRSYFGKDNHNPTIELKASLGKIEELKEKIGELEDRLQNGEL